MLIKITAQTERAAAIIDHMRMFGRKANEKYSVTDLRESVQGSISLIGEQLKLVGIEVKAQLPDSSIPVLGHQFQIEQVILNLLSNARDAIQSSEHAKQKFINLWVDTTEIENVKIIIEDSGGGIPDNVIERIFDPFYTTKEVGKGTGLGLSVSYGIIRDMGGDLKVKNAEQGAQFIITLPRLKQDNPD